MPATKSKKKDYVYAVGRRREASARVRIMKGKGDFEVNGKPMLEYFSGALSERRLMVPFALTDTEGKYFATVKVAGGGKHAQEEAAILGIARALQKVKEDFRAPLKKAGLLTRDPRVRERRKVNTGGKARRQKQSPKR